MRDPRIFLTQPYSPRFMCGLCVGMAAAWAFWIWHVEPPKTRREEFEQRVIEWVNGVEITFLVLYGLSTRRAYRQEEEVVVESLVNVWRIPLRQVESLTHPGFPAGWPCALTYRTPAGERRRLRFEGRRVAELRKKLGL